MNFMKKHFLIFTISIFAGLASAQTGSFTGPTTGYVFDGGTHALRPVLGIPGASTLGAPIDAAGYSLTAAYVAPRLDSFFGIAADGSTHWFAIISGAVTEKTVAGTLGAPERVVFSPSGTAAALYANGQAQIVTGLPSSPTVAGSIALNETSPRHGRRLAPAMAVSDDGAYVLAALNGSVQLAARNGVVRPVIQTGADAVFAFAAGGHDAAVAARGTGAVLIRDVPGAATQQILAGDGPSFNVPVGIAFSADGQRMFVASASEQSVATFDLAGNRADISCSCSPTELTPMGGSFRLNELSGDPLWLLDGGASPRVVFVPALRAAQ
jgi:DNA-binding beta-propeller fold protein YncE